MTWRDRAIVRGGIAISMVLAGIYWRSAWGLLGIPGLILAFWGLTYKRVVTSEDANP